MRVRHPNKTNSFSSRKFDSKAVDRSHFHIGEYLNMRLGFFAIHLVFLFLFNHLAFGGLRSWTVQLRQPCAASICNSGSNVVALDWESSVNNLASSPGGCGSVCSF